MRYRACLYVIENTALINNAVFNNEPIYGMKNCNFMLTALRRQLALKGIDLATQDINPPELSDFVISLDNALPFANAPWATEKRNYLILSEPPVYCPDNWLPDNHKHFDKIFTYNNNIVDNVKYFHYFFAIDTDYLFESERSNIEFEDKKLCAMVAGSFKVRKDLLPKNSLLLERYLTIKWFANNYPKDLDLYSRSIYQKIYYDFRLSTSLRRILPKKIFNIASDIINKRRKNIFFSVTRGAIDVNCKIDKLREYKFSLAYENTCNLSGYLTEKIFDVLAAGCVPIYWGEPNIADIIPAQCFIDRRCFKSSKEMHAFMCEMSSAEYYQYTRNITEFMSNLDVSRFGVEANACRIAKVILEDILA